LTLRIHGTFSQDDQAPLYRFSQMSPSVPTAKTAVTSIVAGPVATPGPDVSTPPMLLQPPQPAFVYVSYQIARPVPSAHTWTFVSWGETAPGSPTIVPPREVHPDHTNPFQVLSQTAASFPRTNS